MHENDYLDALRYAWKYENSTTGSDETQSFWISTAPYDRRPDYFPEYKHENLIGTVTGENVIDEGFAFTTLHPAWYAIFMGYYPDKIIHNGPATIVFWPDGTKTVVKCSENDIYDPFDAFTAALAKKIYGTTSSIKTMLKKVTVEQKLKKKE